MSGDLKERIEERVARGVGWLDANRTDWWDAIDLNWFILSSPCRCVLGQLYGDYMDSPLVEEHGDEAGVERGFNAGGGEWKDATFAEFEALEREWRRVIAERRAER